MHKALYCNSHITRTLNSLPMVARTLLASRLLCGRYALSDSDV